MTIQPDFVELCGIVATVYEKGCEIFFERFQESFSEHVWWFEDAAVHTLADVITPPSMAGAINGSFKSCAVRFEFHPVFNPDYVASHPMNVKSAMDTCVRSGQQYVTALFEGDETDSLKRMAEIALEDVGEQVTDSIFIGVFKVWHDEFRDEDGGLDDVQVSAEFVRKFSLDEVAL